MLSASVLPDAPRNVTLTATDFEEVVLTWTPPERLPGELLYYRWWCVSANTSRQFGGVTGGMRIVSPVFNSPSTITCSVVARYIDEAGFSEKDGAVSTSKDVDVPEYGELSFIHALRL